jgi:hypothetical protein
MPACNLLACMTSSALPAHPELPDTMLVPLVIGLCWVQIYRLYQYSGRRNLYSYLTYIYCICRHICNLQAVAKSGKRALAELILLSHVYSSLGGTSCALATRRVEQAGAPQKAVRGGCSGGAFLILEQTSSSLATIVTQVLQRVLTKYGLPVASTLSSCIP